MVPLASHTHLAVWTSESENPLLSRYVRTSGLPTSTRWKPERPILTLFGAIGSTCLLKILRLPGVGILLRVVQVTSEEVKRARKRQGGIVTLKLELGMDLLFLVKTLELLTSGADIYLSL